MPSGTQPPNPIHIRQESNTGLPPRTVASKSGLVYNVVRRWNAPADQRHRRYHFPRTLDQASTSLRLPPQGQNYHSRRTEKSHAISTAYRCLPTWIWTSLWPQCQRCGAQPLEHDTSVGAPRGYKTSNCFCPETQQFWTISMAIANDLKTCSNLHFSAAAYTS